MLSFLLGIHTEVELLVNMVILFLSFLRVAILLSTVPVPPYIPTNSEPGFQFLYSLTICYVFIFRVAILNACEVITHCTFHLHFSKKLVMLNDFSYTYWPFVYFWRNNNSSSLLIFIQVVWFCC